MSTSPISTITEMVDASSSQPSVILAIAVTAPTKCLTRWASEAFIRGILICRRCPRLARPRSYQRTRRANEADINPGHLALVSAMATARPSGANEPTTPAGGISGLCAGMRVWVNGIPYRLRHQVIGATWAADEIFGKRSGHVQTTQCRECRLHGTLSSVAR